jgi:hypothetical protein
MTVEHFDSQEIERATAPTIRAEGVADGTHSALIALMDATGAYPWTRADILQAISDGVKRAVAEHLEKHGLDPSS